LQIFLIVVVELRGSNVYVSAAHGAKYAFRRTPEVHAADLWTEAALLNAARRDRQGWPLTAALIRAMKKAGVLLGADRLRPTSSASSVRIVDGKTKVLDGPYAESKEQLGGYFMIEAPDLDAALQWAARCPGASHGTIEVRPIWAM
jgi:hypothetical protein